MLQKEKIKKELNCNDDFLKELLEEFILEGRECVQGMNEGIALGNYRIIRDNSHKLLSSTRIFCLEELTSLLKDIEEKAEKEKRLEEIKVLVKFFNMKYEDVNSEVVSYLGVH